MKKIFTFIAMALMTLGAMAENIIEYDGTETLPAGVAYSGTCGYEKAKTETNTVDKYGITLANGYADSNVYNENAITLTYSGGFKTGDIVTIKGFISNSADNKQGGVCIFTIDDSKVTTVVAHSGIFLNGRFENGVSEWQYELTDDMEDIHIGRYAEANATKTFVTYISVERGGKIQNEKPTISIPETASGFTNSDISITAKLAGRPDPTVKWYSNATASNEGGEEISGATSSILKFNTSEVGTYYVYAVAENSEGSAKSSVCTVTVSSPDIYLSDDDKIIFSADNLYAAGTLEGVTFHGGSLHMKIVTDTDKKAFVDANNTYFGTDENSNLKFTARFRTGATSSAKSVITLKSDKAGKLYVYARSGSSTDSRSLALTQDSNDIFNQDFSDSDIQTIVVSEEKTLKIAPYYSCDIEAGEATILYEDGPMNIYGFSLDKDITTGINAVSNVKAENSAIYNALGQRVNANAKGIIIQNGKKYIAK